MLLKGEKTLSANRSVAHVEINFISHWSHWRNNNTINVTRKRTRRQRLDIYFP